MNRFIKGKAIKVFSLSLFDDFYYIKRNAIVEKITFNNRTFYAKFERINAPLTPLLFQQHLNKEYTIAVPLLKNNRTNYLVLEYKGEEHQRFIPLVKHLLKTLDIGIYCFFQGKNEEKIQAFIEVENITLEEADKILLKISDALKTKLTKKWKCLPSSSLPEAYNIVTLPYKVL
ncbi:MAG TPA: hypothetical protein CFH81_05065 [Sulfurovum sp. UBA12169]|nr:MAG TPA: hypothetical protein CFH81_05065 [Sulfurovum sp. UBA12169]